MKRETCKCGSKLSLTFLTDDGSSMQEVTRCRGHHVKAGKTPYKERKEGVPARDRSTKLVKVWAYPVLFHLRLRNEPCVINAVCRNCGMHYRIRGKSKGVAICNLRETLNHQKANKCLEH